MKKGIIVGVFFCNQLKKKCSIKFLRQQMVLLYLHTNTLNGVNNQKNMREYVQDFTTHPCNNA